LITSLTRWSGISCCGGEGGEETGGEDTGYERFILGAIT
jgi:hypothetical protein